jgi:glycosyltransferase involved in cell wall biosynthesis
MADTPASPLVTVVLTTYNRPSYLREAVASVQKQTYPNVELIVVDDHSDTPASETLADVSVDELSQFKCLRHEENRGANAARNTGIEAATGRYVALLDDDDTWVTNKIERQVAAFQEADDDVGVVYCGIRWIGDDDEWIDIPPEITDDITKSLLCRNVVRGMSVVMVRTDMALEVQLDDRFPSWADLEWYIRLSQRCAFERIPEPLVVYESTSHGRLSDDFEKTQRSYTLFIDEFDEVAASYGPAFRRKMRGWAAYRAGRSALQVRAYADARRLLLTAVLWYPVESRFYKYLLASLGGRITHDAARTLIYST